MEFISLNFIKRREGKKKPITIFPDFYKFFLSLLEFIGIFEWKRGIR